jgi:hypothetical protein
MPAFLPGRCFYNLKQNQPDLLHEAERLTT